MSNPSTIRALIVGATGTVGSSLINEFIKPQYSNKIYTTVLTRSSTLNTTDTQKKQKIQKWLNHGVTFIEGDIENESISSIVEKLKLSSSTHTQKSYDVLFSTVGTKLKKDGQLKLIDIA